MFLMLLVLPALLLPAGADYCDDLERSSRRAGRIPACPDCVEALDDQRIRVNCAYCANTDMNMAHCQRPFFPPATAGLPLYGCYNNTPIVDPAPQGYYKPRCSMDDCMMNQCVGAEPSLKWWHILLITLVAFVIVAVATYYLCINCMGSYWAARAERRAEERRFLQTRDRVAVWNVQSQTLRGKYYGAVPTTEPVVAVGSGGV